MSGLKGGGKVVVLEGGEGLLLRLWTVKKAAETKNVRTKTIKRAEATRKTA